MNTKQWSSVVFGWVLRLSDELRPVHLKSPEEVLEYNTKALDEIQREFPEGVSFASRQDYLGQACIVGPEEMCLALKRNLEVSGKAAMVKNVPVARAI